MTEKHSTFCSNDDMRDPVISALIWASEKKDRISAQARQREELTFSAPYRPWQDVPGRALLARERDLAQDWFAPS